MKKIYFLAFLFLCTFLTIGTNTAWGETAAVGDILWAENFAHFENNTPSKAQTGVGTTIFGGATITYSQSSTSTKGYDANLAKGTAPELLLAKKNTTWTISGIPTGGATEMRLTFLSNKAAFGLTTTTQNLTISGKEKTWTIQVEEGKTAPETFDITLKNTAQKDNARIDNVSIVVVTAASSVSEKVSLVYNANGSTGGTVPATASYDKGATVTVAGNTGGLVKTGFDFAGWNTAANGSGITYQEGNTFIINANTTLYALWTAQSNKLSTPTNLKTTDITSNSAKLSWDAVPHATKYIVTYAETNSPAITSTTYVLSGLLPNTHYLWTVKAVGDATYEDSEKSSTADFTTLPTPYTIKWSTPDGTDTKQVTPGDKVVLPATDPTSCSSTYTNFVGWFTEAAGSESNPSTAKPATQVTAATIPTGDATYYAVFSDATGDGTWNLVTDVASLAAGDRIIIAAETTDVAISTTQNTKNRKGTPITKEGSTLSTPSAEVQIFTLENGTKPNTWAFNTGSGYIYAASSSENQLKTQSSNDDNGSWTITLGSSATIKAQGKNTRNVLRYNSSSNLFSCYGSGQEEVVLYKQVSSATGYISSCCNDPAVVTVTPATTTINLGEDGKATTTVTCTQQNGGTAGTWSYSVSPSTATFNGTDFVATAAGEYTLTATYTETCGKSGMATITVTNTPVLYFPTPTPADPIKFGIVECGGNTPLTDKQTISLRGYNLTSDVTVTVTGDYKIAGTESTALADYTTSLTLPKDAVSGSSASVYVLSTPPHAEQQSHNGKGYIYHCRR